MAADPLKSTGQKEKENVGRVKNCLLSARRNWLLCYINLVSQVLKSSYPSVFCKWLRPVRRAEGPAPIVFRTRVYLYHRGYIIGNTSARAAPTSSQAATATKKKNFIPPPLPQQTQSYLPRPHETGASCNIIISFIYHFLFCFKYYETPGRKTTRILALKRNN